MQHAIVITADRRRSRASSHDAVPGMLEELSDVPGTLRPFMRTVGDELQGVLPTTPEAILRTLPPVLDRLSTGEDWWIGIGIGPAQLASDAVSSSGPAFYAAREAIDLAKRGDLTGSVALRIGFADAQLPIRDAFDRTARLELGRALDSIEALGATAAQLWRTWEIARIAVAHRVELLRGRSPQGREAVAHARLGRTGEQIGQTLGITRQAVEKRLASAGWPRAERESLHLMGLSLLALASALEAPA